jgi:hypothetical protein
MAQPIGLSERTVQRDLRTTTLAGRQRRSEAAMVCWTRTKPRCASGGMLAAIRPCDGSATSNSGATRGAMRVSRPLHAVDARRRGSLLGNAARSRPCRAWPSPYGSPLRRVGPPGSSSGAKTSAPQTRHASVPSGVRSTPRWTRRSTSRRILRPWAARGSRRSAIPSSRARPPGRWRPYAASPLGCMRTMPRSKPASRGPGVLDRSRGTSIASQC